MKQNNKHGSDGRKRLLWSVLFVVIAAATLWAVMSHSRTFTFADFSEYLSDAKKPWLVMALLSALGFVFFEGKALRKICRAFGYNVGHGRGFIYSAADIYFSAITPSATGGQPMCAYFMMKDGIPASVTTVILLLNLAMYTLSILWLNLIVVITQPTIFASFGLISKALIILGYVIQILLAVFFVMLLLKGDFLHRICRSALHFACKIKLLKREDEKQRRLDEHMAEYAACSEMIKEHNGAVAWAFFYNVLQRAAYISVPFFVYLAAGGGLAKSAEIWAIQSYVVIGANTIPIPGAMGVSDYIMLDGFGNMMPYQDAVNFELLSRTLSFYVCVIICGLTVLGSYLIKCKARNEK